MTPLDFKKIIGYFKEHKEKEIFDKSLKDWERLIILFSLLMLSLWLVDWYAYTKNMSFEEATSFVGDEKFETVNKNLLSEIIKDLDDKERQTIENFSAPNLSDPSI